MYRLYQYRSCWAKGNTCCISIQICHGHITLYMTFLAMILNASRIMVHPQVVVWNAILKAYTCPLNHPLVNQSEQVNTDLSVKVAENLPNQACKMTLIQWFFSYNFLDVMIPPKKKLGKKYQGTGTKSWRKSLHGFQAKLRVFVAPKFQVGNVHSFAEQQ